MIKIKRLKYNMEAKMKTSRLKNVLKHMEENKIPQLIVTSAQSIFYLTGK